MAGNIKDDIRSDVLQDRVSSELAKALEGMFTITFFRRFKEFDALYRAMYCKPTRTIAESLLLQREVLALVANFTDLQVRTLKVAKTILSKSAQRLDPAILIVVHADPRGDEKLHDWARNDGIKIIPIYRAKAGAIPPTEILRRNLARELFSHDPFQLTGPVLADMDFFGRGGEAVDVLRNLQVGRIRAFFGIRKVGKTSLINRVVNLARTAGEPRVAMIDCSVDHFCRLRVDTALRALAKTCKLAATRGYGHVTEALNRTDDELVPTFDDLWSHASPPPLAVVFDEVDYITPESPAHRHWREDFVPFWRQVRVVLQEAQRHGLGIAMLVSGVSSRSFRRESIDGVENPVLQFIPEEYLSPFSRVASQAMIRDLARRAGLHFDDPSQQAIAETCCDLPFWVRMAGSHINRAVEVDGRPLNLPHTTVLPLLETFVQSDGAEIAQVALEDLVRKDPDILTLLRDAATNGYLPIATGRLLVRYGLAAQDGQRVVIRSNMVLAGLSRIGQQGTAAPPITTSQSAVAPRLVLADTEWAEELAIINRRRNLLERRLREYTRVVLKLSLEKGKNWTDEILRSLPEKTRTELSGLGGDSLMESIYWSDLEKIISRYWSFFEKTFSDKKRFQLAMGLLNDRPDAHAKPADAADIALYRRELTWLEERIA